MALEQWAYIGEIIAAAAVIASLIYLGPEEVVSYVDRRLEEEKDQIGAVVETLDCFNEHA